MFYHTLLDSNVKGKYSTIGRKGRMDVIIRQSQ